MGSLCRRTCLTVVSFRPHARGPPHPQDLVFRKVNESDASKFAKMTKVCPSQFWGVVWCFISLAFMAGAIVGGLAAF